MQRAKLFWNSFSSELLNTIYPSRCALCGVLGPLAICIDCENEMSSMQEPLRPQFEGIVMATCLYAYDGRPAMAVKRLKYQRITSLIAPMSALIADFAGRHSLLDADIVVPVPIHWQRRSMRGFNQAEALAERLPHIDRSLLVRHRATQPQVLLDRDQRKVNLIDAFRCRRRIDGSSVLLIDDVSTTGHTAQECARALQNGGARTVKLLTFCGESA
jgi:ComF family protein